MKKYTRFLALLLALAMLLSCSTSALAENAGSADEYYQFIHEYLNEQRRLENWTPEIFLSEQAVVSEGFTRPAPFMPPVSAPVSTFALARMSANDYGIALIDENAEDPDGNSLVTSKTTTKNTGDGYKVRIEAFATGTTTTIQQSKPIPTDIVLVLDQSGSMANPFNVKIEAGYHEYGKNLTNDDYWKLINADKKTVWYKVSDQQWVQVQVEKVYTGNPEYSRISKPGNLQQGTYREKLLNLADSGDLYYLVNGNYVRVLVERYSKQGYQRYRYYYMNGTQKNVIEEDLYVNYNAPEKTYYENTQPYTYRYFYTVDTNENGQYDAGVDEKVIIVENSAGKTTAPLPLGSEENFYYYETENNDNGQTTNLLALQNAVTIFADQVAAKAAADKVNHRLAIVGFASQSGYGNNTEILTVSGDNSGIVGVQYNSLEDSDYQNAFQDMGTESGKTMVTNAINALTAQGATEADLGMKMAVNIFVKDLYTPKEGEVRNKVVIMFTDGSPTTYDVFDGSVANDAIGHAKTLKGKNITVYTVGIFNGAKLTKPITLENLPGNSGSPNRENRFMQLVSSNYLKATTMDSTGNEVNPNIGTGSYYLPATNASELNDIFKSISSNIQSGSTSVTLDATSKVQDIVSDFFVPIKGNKTNVTVKTADYAGMTDGVRKWTNEQTAAGVTPTIDGNTVSVKGFDFKANYVATVNDIPQGQKLIIEFDIKPATGFLGGNNVPTNGSASGIYDGQGVEAELFDIPKVNVPIVMPTVSLTDKNVYLLEDLKMAQLYPDGAIDVKDANGKSVTLDYTKTNGGLEEWQMAYATLGIALNHQNGMSDLMSDTEFEASVTITPKPIADGEKPSNQGQAATEQKASDKKTVYVFKPELTFKDDQVDYMSAISETGYLYNDVTKTFAADNLVSKDDSNKVKPVWKTESGVELTNQTMTGEEPTLTLAYAPIDGVDADMKVDSTTYVPMQVTVKIGDTPVTEHVTFMHTEECPDDDCEWETAGDSDGSPAFLLHVENVNGDLKITKTVNWNGKHDAEQTFLFKVEGTKVNGGAIAPIWVSIDFKDGDHAKTITIEKLPAGTYSVTEMLNDKRYTASPVKVENLLVNGSATQNADFTNTLTNDKWLDDEHSVDNLFTEVTTK